MKRQYTVEQSKQHSRYIIAVLKGKYDIEYKPGETPRGVDQQAVFDLAAWWMENGPEGATPETCRLFYEWYRKTYVTKGVMMVEREDTIMKYWPVFCETYTTSQPRQSGRYYSPAYNDPELNLSRFDDPDYGVGGLDAFLASNPEYAARFQDAADRKQAQYERGNRRAMRMSRHDGR